MIEPSAFYAALHRSGVTFFSGVPDSLLKDLCAYISAHTPASEHVINANEGSAVALAAGYHLATGRIPAVYLQNSGIGNAINPLVSLIDPAVYGIPILFIVGWRGEPGVSDEPQHVKQGAVMTRLLEAIGLDYDIVDANTPDLDVIVDRVCRAMASSRRPHALLIRKGTFGRYDHTSDPSQRLECTRADIIDLVLSSMGEDDVLVSTTGMTSREVFDYRQRTASGPRADFLTVGSMGHSSQIALGIALQRPSRRVVCLDGDGAVLMHMGSLAIIGTQGPENLTHLVINNGAHDSVGGQPTAAAALSIAAIARACGYREAESVATSDAMRYALARALRATGPIMVEFRARSSPKTSAGRPTTTPAENKTRFMRALAE